MEHSNTDINLRDEKGFTLVELAVVMIIIGLLIGGVLKGQELISNAQVTSTVAQIKAFDAATSTFRDQYNAFPGDLLAATTRLPGCAAPCAAGSGNGIVDSAVGIALVNTGEAFQYFAHLAAADLITGVDRTNSVQFGAGFPAASVGGGFSVGHRSAAAPTGFASTEMRNSHYLWLNGTTGANAAASGPISPGQAERIDRKLDDGAPHAGAVVGNNFAASCRTLAADTTYATASDDQSCTLAFRIQG